jgi:hypothetical protein
MTISEWAQFICQATAGAFGLVCVFDGTRRMMAGLPGRGRAGRLAVGVTIVAILAGAAYWQHRTQLNAASVARAQQKVPELPADWGKKMSGAKREAASRGLAQRTFVASGTLTPYFDAAGQRRVYAPTPEDIKLREAGVAAAARIDARAGSSLTEAVLWLVLGLAAFLFGLCFGVERAAKPDEAGPEAEAEAQA